MPDDFAAIFRYGYIFSFLLLRRRRYAAVAAMPDTALSRFSP